MQEKQPTYIILLAFGKRGYGFAAYNLAESLKYFNNDVFVHLMYSPNATEQLTKAQKMVFDKYEEMPESYYMTNGKIDPGKAKVSFYKHLIYENALYIDVDSLALQDITPFFNKLQEKEGFFYTDVWGYGGFNDEIEYNLWATNENIYNFFKLDKEKDKINAVNTSYMFVRKGEEAENFFNKLQENYSQFPMELLLRKWGLTMPDEIIYTGTMAQLNINPKTDLPRPVFFGNKISEKSVTQLQKEYYLLSIYGDNGARKLTRLMYLDWYNGLIKHYDFGGYKWSYIMPDKHLNNK